MTRYEQDMKLTDIGGQQKIVLPSIVIHSTKPTMTRQCGPCIKHLYICNESSSRSVGSAANY